MEATFDNKTNLLSANLRSSVDNSVLYTITTSHNLWGRTVTLLKDTNPAPGDSPIVGAIYWRERLFEVNGHRKSISDLKHKSPGFARRCVHPPCSSCWALSRPRSSAVFGQAKLGEWWHSFTCNARNWRWGAEKTEYELAYHHEEWQALAILDDEKKDEKEEVAASLRIPYRNHLFHRTKPAVLKMTSSALMQDEVFLLLVMIYSETKRQDSTNCSSGW